MLLTFPPPGVCVALSKDPIFDRAPADEDAREAVLSCGLAATVSANVN